MRFDIPSLLNDTTDLTEWMEGCFPYYNWYKIDKIDNHDVNYNIITELHYCKDVKNYANYQLYWET